MQPPRWLREWATPARLLLLLCTTCLVIFLDRGVVASNGVNGGAGATEGGFQEEFGLTLFQDGLVAALYYVGLMLGAPVFAQLSKHFNAFRLVGIGTVVYIIGAVMCGFSYAFATILVGRAVVGAGAGAIIALGPPLIDDHAPPARIALWIGLIYLCMPTGVALGYLLGGALGSALGWRSAFWTEAGAAAPFALVFLLLPPVDIKRRAAPAAAPSRDGAAAEAAAGTAGAVAAAAGREGAAGGKGWQLCRGAGRAFHAFFQDLAQLAQHPVPLTIIAALTMWNGFLGAYGYYGPQAVRDLFGMSSEDADFVFGAVLAAAGIIGSLTGGALLDYVGASMRSGLLICTAGLGACCALALLALLAARSLTPFWVLFGSAELALFTVQAPANAVCMWSVPPELRAFALSISEAMQHLLGDIPSPPAMGATQGSLQDWRLSLALFVLLPAAGTLAFLAGAVLAKGAPDYRKTEGGEDQQQADAAAGGAGTLGAAAAATAEEGGSGSLSRSGGRAHADLEQQAVRDELVPLAFADALRQTSSTEGGGG